jgi:predicted nuclease of predicted toxin-antitoxin system
MPVSIKVDEDLPPAVAQVFGQAGHDAKSVLEQGWSGCPDDVLLTRVRAEGRWLVTADRGFADVPDRN